MEIRETHVQGEEEPKDKNMEGKLESFEDRNVCVAGIYDAVVGL